MRKTEQGPAHSVPSHVKIKILLSVRRGGGVEKMNLQVEWFLGSVPKWTLLRSFGATDGQANGPGPYVLFHRINVSRVGTEVDKRA